MANNQFIENNFYQHSSDVCTPDITPPTFGGITGLSGNVDGSGLASWAAGSDPSTPISYNIYVQANTATGLFSGSNLAANTDLLAFNIYRLRDQSLLQAGVTYYIGVRAKDKVGNESSNTQSMSFVSSGVQPPTINYVYEIRGTFSINASNQLRATFWSTRNGQVGLGTLGTASYTIYDQDGNTVGITESGIVADVNGRFRITPVVVASALQDLAHYVARVTVIHDGSARTTDIGITLGE